MDTNAVLAERLRTAGYSSDQITTALHAAHTTGLVLTAGRCAHGHQVRPLRMWVGGHEVQPAG